MNQNQPPNTANSETALDTRVALHRQDVHIRPYGHPERSIALGNLANSLRLQYRVSGRLRELEEAIALYREALQLLPYGHPDRPSYLNNLAATIHTQYDGFGEFKDLEEAITLHQEALSLVSQGHLNRTMFLSNLAGTLQTRYERRGILKDLEDSIALNQEALQLQPQGHPNRPFSLSNLASSLITRYERSGMVKDLEDAIALNQESLQLRGDGHPYRSSSLNNLAASLATRYERFSMPRDLEEAITLQREALQLQPQGTPKRSMFLSNLADSLRTQYKQSGTMKYLDESIALNREALQLRPQGHPDRSMSFHNLAISLANRYERTVMIKDLEEAIALNREAVHLRPQGHPHRASSLSSLAATMRRRYDASGILKELEEATLLHREALQLQPHGHPERSTSLNNLANSLLVNRRVQSNEAEDLLEEAIALHREALQLRPQEHPDRSMSLGNLAGALQIRYKGTGIPRDLEEAITLQREALQLEPHGHPNRAMSLHRLARSMASMHGPNMQPGHVAPEVQRMALDSVDYRYTSPIPRLRIALEWAESASTDTWFRLRMHRSSLLLLQQMLIINPDSTHQQQQLLAFSPSDSAASGVATAIEAGEIKEALVLLHLGKSIFLSTLQRYRTPLDDLRALDSDLADELQAVGSRLENLAMLHNHPEGLPRHATLIDYTITMQRELIQKWDDLISQIRKLPGLEDFLGILPYHKLEAATKHGPIVFLNASKIRCDAIIMAATSGPTLVPLPNTSWSELRELAELLERLRSLNNPRKRRADLLYVLRSLWDAVVSPIVEKLISLGFEPGLRSRIWLCPTSWFNVLPIHAAGLHDGGRSSALPDLFVPSYTPSATSLLRSMKDREMMNTSPTNSVLFVGYTGDGDLEGIKPELEYLQGLKSIETKSLLNDAATPNGALEEMKAHSWIHLACHGEVEYDGPLNSRFKLKGGDLHVQDIIKARLENAEFAFLSACHSAAGGRAIPDENLHLASALQFAGFRSVVGTMWGLYDHDAPELTRDFYIAMAKMGGRYSNAAVALQYAIRQMRKRQLGPERWAMIIHVGA